MSTENQAPSNTGATGPIGTNVLPPLPPSANSQGTGNTPPPAPVGDWTSSLAPELKAIADAKGFKDPSQAMESYHSLEKLMGDPKKLFKVPDKDDAPEWNDIFNKLGRPGKPEEYGFTVPEGGNKEWTDWISNTLFDVGLTRKQAEKLVSKWNEYHHQGTEGQKQAQVQQIESQKANLKKEWGAAYDQNVRQAYRAANEFGLSNEMVNKLGETLGVDGTMKFLQKVGNAIGEDTFVTGDREARQGAMTPAGAQARIATLKKDQDWVKRYNSGETKQREEMDRLMRWAYPDDQAEAS